MDDEKDRFDRLEKKIETLVTAMTIPPGAMSVSQPSGQQEIDLYDKLAEDFSPVTKVYKGLKWVFVVITPIVAGTVAWVKFEGEVATKSDIEKHRADDFVPVQSQVSAVEHGVNTLLLQQERERAIKVVEQELAEFRAEYESRMDDYRTRVTKRPDRYFKKPQMYEKMIELNAKLKKLLKEPIPIPLGIPVDVKRD